MPKRRRTRRKSNDGVIIKSAEMLGWALGGIEREIVQTRERLAALTHQAAQLRAQIGARPATPKDRLPAAAQGGAKCWAGVLAAGSGGRGLKLHGHKETCPTDNRGTGTSR